MLPIMVSNCQFDTFADEVARAGQSVWYSTVKGSGVIDIGKVGMVITLPIWVQWVKGDHVDHVVWVAYRDKKVCHCVV